MINSLCIQCHLFMYTITDPPSMLTYFPRPLPTPAANFHIPKAGPVFDEIIYSEIYGPAAQKIVQQYREDALGIPSYPSSKRGRYDRGGGRYGPPLPRGGGGYPPYRLAAGFSCTCDLAYQFCSNPQISLKCCAEVCIGKWEEESSYVYIGCIVG